MFDALGQVDAQHIDRCSADRSLAAKDRAVPSEVVVPIIETRREAAIAYEPA